MKKYNIDEYDSYFYSFYRQWDESDRVNNGKEMNANIIFEKIKIQFNSIKSICDSNKTKLLHTLVMLITILTLQTSVVSILCACNYSKFDYITIGLTVLTAAITLFFVAFYSIKYRATAKAIFEANFVARQINTINSLILIYKENISMLEGIAEYSMQSVNSSVKNIVISSISAFISIVINIVAIFI